MIKILLALTIGLFQSSLYSHQLTGINGTTIDLNDHHGKKILLVNIATSGPRVGQLAELQQLQDQYSDSLLVIGFPSNSFGNESRDNADIKTFCETQYNTSFLLASKGSVKGEDIQSFYYWLTHATENGLFDNPVQSDFEKYLFDSAGNPLAVFAGQLSPLSPQLTNVITGNINQ